MFPTSDHQTTVQKRSIIGKRHTHFFVKQIYFLLKKYPKTIYARDGDRTHAHIRELDLKSNALTTRPPWLYVNLKP